MQLRSMSIKAGFHMIADDRESQIANHRRSQTIAGPAAAIHFGQQKCQMYTRVVHAAKS